MPQVEERDPSSAPEGVMVGKRKYNPWAAARRIKEDMDYFEEKFFTVKIARHTFAQKVKLKRSRFLLGALAYLALIVFVATSPALIPCCLVRQYSDSLNSAYWEAIRSGNSAAAAYGIDPKSIGIEPSPLIPADPWSLEEYIRSQPDAIRWLILLPVPSPPVPTPPKPDPVFVQATVGSGWVDLQPRKVPLADLLANRSLNELPEIYLNLTLSVNFPDASYRVAEGGWGEMSATLPAGASASPYPPLYSPPKGKAEGIFYTRVRAERLMRLGEPVPVGDRPGGAPPSMAYTVGPLAANNSAYTIQGYNSLRLNYYICVDTGDTKETAWFRLEVSLDLSDPPSSPKCRVVNATLSVYK